MSKYKGKSIENGGRTYTFIQLLKNGGNGIVWEAECCNEQYAIKILKRFSKENKKRFLNETRFCKENSHENLINVYGFGKFNDELYYIMPLYNETFREVIEIETNYLKYFNFILQIGEGLRYIHDRGVIHRDIKPENILVKEEKLVLTDLGIAHFEGANITQPNDRLANKSYAAPEQRKDGYAKEISKAVDIYALGCIINELFTKENPLGTNFIEIADMYPWLGDLDRLVEQCMRQNPSERPTIEEVILEIKCIERGIQQDATNIRDFIKHDFELEKIELNSVASERFFYRASEDILAAKYIFENVHYEDINKYYNHNYNCDIHYRIDEELKKLYFDMLLFEKCKDKFYYESNVYKNGSYYTPLDLTSDDDRKIYEEFKHLMEMHGYINGGTLKMFSSCCNYHCEEIINNISYINKIVSDLDDAPILYIVMKLKEVFERNQRSIKEIEFESNILVNWKLTVRDLDSSYGTVKTSLKLDFNNQREIDILDKFKEIWNIVYKKSDEKYIVRFQDKNSYSEFKKFSLQLSKPYNIFEGDVLSLVKIQRFYDEIIELKPLDSFDITNVLAKILGLRNDY
ncbi:serine/threonine-protein kinase [Enterococcus sp. BWR-S5]|uniref:serine/threonine-protein kinase n=1 Tax=Enterococcus sp. BWR-S5 TaxID=2787714 RepID=UPI0019210E51|nr:serine/threonine-protein kinase [Enterococcus sp. BWR-S5]MBL1225236.1 serine/threonine protein kinase [Enterococcus sp. BWR-S5]